MLYSVLIKTFSTYIKILPFIILAYLLLYFFRKIKVKKYINKIKNKKMLAFLLGILSHGPVYMWYPIIKELDFKDNEKFAFLYLRAIKLPHIPLQMALLGLDLTLVLNLYIILVSLLFLYGTSNSRRLEAKEVYSNR